jgi:hypothetical protein
LNSTSATASAAVLVRRLPAGKEHLARSILSLVAILAQDSISFDIRLAAPPVLAAMEASTSAKKPRLAAPPMVLSTEVTGAMLPADVAKKHNKKVEILEGVVLYQKSWSVNHSGAVLDWKLHSLNHSDGTVTETWHGVAKQ